jgi:hypothetical protein
MTSSLESSLSFQRAGGVVIRLGRNTQEYALILKLKRISLLEICFGARQ